MVRIDNKKHTYRSSAYEIVIEEVVDLGVFVEVELIDAPDDIDDKKAKQDIRDFVVALGINVGEELNSGKPELMLKAKGIAV